MLIERGAFYLLSGLVFLLCSTTPPQPGHSNQGLWSSFWWGSCLCILCRFTHVWFFATLWTVARQAPLSMGFSRQEFYWSRLSCPSPGDLPNSGIETMSLTSPALAGGFFTSRTTWEAQWGLEWTPNGCCVCVCGEVGDLTCYKVRRRRNDSTKVVCGISKNQRTRKEWNF